MVETGGPTQKLGRRPLMAGLATLCSTIAAAAQPLRQVRIGLSAAAIMPAHLDLMIPEALGYYKDEGLTCEGVPLGSFAASFANLNAGRLDFSLNVSSFELPLLARGELGGVINFMETTYPFRYGMAVKPGSKVTRLAELKGQRIGDSGPGFATRNVARTVLRAAGLDPDNDVAWLGVGDGMSGGMALQRGDIDGLFYADNGFGLVEAAGIPIRYLPLPPSLPKLGGIYLATTKATLRADRPRVAKFGRAIAKGLVFIRENPEAACQVFGQMFPQVLPKGQTPEQRIKALLVPLRKRIPFYTSDDPDIPKPGYSSDKQWRDEIAFARIQGALPPLSSIYTNELIEEIDDFDHDAVRAQARAYKAPP